MKKEDALKKGRKVIFLAVLTLLCIMMLPVKADAARLDKTSFILLKGKTSTVSLKKYPKKTRKFAWKKSGKAVKIIRKKKGVVKIKAVKQGTSVLKIKSGKEILRCRVTVIGSRAKIKLEKGSGTTLELGKKVTRATSSDAKVVKAVKKGTAVKLTALESGKARILAATAGGSVTKLEITVPGREVNRMPDTPTETDKSETPGTEPVADRPATPGTEPVTDKPEMPGTKPGTDKPETPGTEENSGENTEETFYSYADGTLKDGFFYVCGDKRQICHESWLENYKNVTWMKYGDARVDWEKFNCCRYFEKTSWDLAYYYPVNELGIPYSFTTVVDGEEIYVRIQVKDGASAGPGIVDGYNNPLHDGDTFYYTNVREDEDGSTEWNGGLEVSFVQETNMKQISWKLENNENADGNMIFAVSAATCSDGEIGVDNVHSFTCEGIDLIPLHAGEADFTVSNGTITTTVHLVSDGGETQEARYYEWLHAMVTTDLGVEKDITVYGETIHIDGVKGRDDAETIANLAIWIANHKIWSSEYYGSFYTIYRDSYLGAECGGLNSILTDATCVMGHLGWLTLDDTGHTDARAVIDGWTWGYDVGGAGTTLPRAMEVSGFNFAQTEGRMYNSHSGSRFNGSGFDTPAIVGDHYNWYFILDENGNWVEREWVW